jgi:exonuclease SbcC
MLSQGEFAKFLKAPRKEQVQLLEQLSATQHYRKIGAEAYRVWKEKKDQIQQLEEQLGFFTLLSEEEVQSLQDELKQCTEELDGLAKALEKLRATNNQIKNIKEAETAMLQQEKALKEQETVMENLQPLQQALTLHQKALPLKSLLDRKKDKQEFLSKLQKRTADEENKLQQLAKEKEALLKNAQEWLGSTKPILEIIPEVDEVLSLYRKFQKELSILENTKKFLREQLAQEYKSLSENSKTFIGKDKNEFQQRIQQLREDIAKQLEGSDAVALEKEQAQLQDLSTAVIQLNERSNSNRHNREHWHKAAMELEKSVIFLDNTNKEFEELNELQKLDNQLIEALEKQLEIERKQEGIETYRNMLVPGEDCPLCGNTVHEIPHSHQVQSALTEQKLKNKKEEYRVRLEKLSQLTAARDTAKKNQDEKRPQLLLEKEKLEKETEVLTAEFERIAQHTGQENLSLEELGAWINRRLQTCNKLKSLLPEQSIVLRIQKNLQEQEDVQLSFDQQWANRPKAFDMEHLDEVLSNWKSQLEKNTLNEKTCSDNLIDLKKNNETAFSDLNEVSAELQKEIRQHQWMDENAILSALMDETKARETDEKINKEKELLTKLKTTLENNSNNIKTWKSTLDSNIDVQKLEQDLSSKTEQEQLLNQKKGSTTEKLNNDAALKKKQNDIHQKLTDLRKESRKWEILNQLIGDQTGSRFSEMVQEITLHQLLQFANTHLAGLSDRYRLVRPEEKSSDLMVEDRYMGSSLRHVSTLSGGETFLLSMSLALGLSDLASRNIRIDSLFIDEGFGTLDPETLDQAISTLEKLQSSSQKMIGIISHVDALKERIQTQIQLIPNSNGISRLEIVN